MERNLSVLVVEDDQQACLEIVAYLEDKDDISLVGVTNSSFKAVEYIRDFAPDAVILDLELHLGSGNGLLVLQEIHNMSLSVRPYVLITTNNSSAITYESVRRLGADFIMSKHQTDYSAKSVIDFLTMMRPVIQNHTRATAEHLGVEAPEKRHKRIHRRICTELDLVGVSRKVVGYRYLADSIELAFENPVQGICGIVGKKHGKTESSVERAMQNALNKAWRTTDIDQLLTHYTAKMSSAKGVPTITEFVYYYADKIANEY